MPVFIIITLMAIGALLAYSFRLYQLDRSRAGTEQLSIPPDNPGETGAAAQEEEPEELVNLAEYFSDTPKEAASPLELDEALYDKLCDVKVGQAYLDDCQQALNGAKRRRAGWAVLSIDIDRFRFINSLRGFSLGDYAIAHLLQELQAILPETALISRKSADHLIACLPIHDPADLEEYTGLLRRSSDRIRVDIGIKSGLHLAIGAALTSEGGYDIDLLLAKATLARHSMKSSKTENFVLYNETMVTSLLFGESALEDYSDYQYGDEIVLYFQPQSDISKNIITSAQVLTRWACEDSVSKDLLVTPENGKIPTNGGKVLYQSCLEISRWRKAGKELLPILVYLPIQDFFKSDINALFAKIITEFQLDTALVVPVIESAIIRIHPEMAKVQLQKFADLGIRTAVDAITATVPRFDHLAGLPLSYVKVPRGLTAAVERKPEREKFLRQVHQNITELGLTPIYEGVDDISRMKVIRGVGGMLAEGYYAGRPALSEDFSRILQEYVQKRKSYDSTVILNNDEFLRGDYKL